MHHLKKPAFALHLKAPRGFYVLNNYEFMVHHVPINRKQPKDFNEEKKI